MTTTTPQRRNLSATRRTTAQRWNDLADFLRRAASDLLDDTAPDDAAQQLAPLIAREAAALGVRDLADTILPEIDTAALTYTLRLRPAAGVDAERAIWAAADHLQSHAGLNILPAAQPNGSTAQDAADICRFSGGPGHDATLVLPEPCRRPGLTIIATEPDQQHHVYRLETTDLPLQAAYSHTLPPGLGSHRLPAVAMIIKAEDLRDNEGAA